VISSRPYNQATALREIEEIMELQKSWSPEWLLNNCGPKSVISEERKKEPWVYVPLGSRRERVGIVHWKKNQQTATKFKFVFPEHNWGQLGPEREWSVNDFPKTVSGFRKWWEALQKSRHVIVPILMAEKGYLDDEERGGYASLLPGDPLVSDSRLPRVNLGLALTESHIPAELVYIAGVPYKLANVNFPVVMSRNIEMDQGKLNGYFRNWRHGPFDTTFADLAQAASGLEDLELEDVKKSISDEVAKGTEVFEAFGMKLPAEQITFWGIVFLLAVQLYFSVHLMQLSGKLRLNDPGWDVPWIGMYQSFSARLIFFATLVLLPCIAVALLGGRAAMQLTADYWDKTGHFWRVSFRRWDPWIIARLLGFMSSLVIAVILAGLSWRSRPRIRAQVPSAQLFE
jgi:hypothetical protein